MMHLTALPILTTDKKIKNQKIKNQKNQTKKPKPKKPKQKKTKKQKPKPKSDIISILHTHFHLDSV